MRISDWSSDVCSSDLSCAQRVRTERTECHAQETVQRANRQPRIHAASTTRKRIPRSCSLAISASPIACAGVTQPEMLGSLSHATDRADSASSLADTVYPGRTEEGRGGNEGVRRVRTWWEPWK